jgi:DNA-dependent metalloprotease WSS1
MSRGGPRGPRAPPAELEPLIGSFVHEAHRPRADEALKSLQKIASMVKPIMRTRNWFVGQLTEFYPAETNLLGLNVNRGQEIRIRLRYHGDANQFLPFEQVVDTMLHELSHIVHGPHDDHFHALWNQLRDEHETLLRKGYTGEGFLGKGNRVGGTGRIPMHEARRKARAAAEKRRTLTAGSGQKLGGSGALPRSANEARAAILAAIERRKIIERGCGVGTDEDMIEQATRPDDRNVVTTKAANIDVDEDMMMKAFIDLIQEEERNLHGDSYVPPSQENPSGMRALGPPPPLSPNTLRAQQVNIEAELKKNKLPPALPTDTKPKLNSGTKHVQQWRPTPSVPIRPTQKTTPLAPSLPETWTCNICTLINPIHASHCDVCEGPRPAAFSPLEIKKDAPNALKPRLKSEDAWARIMAQEDAKNQSKAAAWKCHSCLNFNDQMWWSCENCGTVKISS